MRAPGAPTEVALGMAIGLFIAMLPILGLQMGVAVAVVELLRRLTGIQASRVAAAIGVWFTNPLTAAPLYALCLLIGRPIARLTLGLWDPETTGILGESASEAIVGLMFGGVILGVVAAAIGYEVTRRVVVAYQHRRVARQRARALRAIGADDLLEAESG